MNRIIRAIRRDLIDARTAIGMGEWRMALPGWLYAKTFYFAGIDYARDDTLEDLAEMLVTPERFSPIQTWTYVARNRLDSAALDRWRSHIIDPDTPIRFS